MMGKRSEGNKRRTDIDRRVFAPMLVHCDNDVDFRAHIASMIYCSPFQSRLTCLRLPPGMYDTGHSKCPKGKSGRVGYGQKRNSSMRRNGSSKRIRPGEAVSLVHISAVGPRLTWIARFLAAEEKITTPYRFEVYDILVLPPSFPYGGMVS